MIVKFNDYKFPVDIKSVSYFQEEKRMVIRFKVNFAGKNAMDLFKKLATYYYSHDTGILFVDKVGEFSVVFVGLELDNEPTQTDVKTTCKFVLV